MTRPGEQIPSAPSLDDEIKVHLPRVEMVPFGPVQDPGGVGDRGTTTAAQGVHPATLDRLERAIARAERVHTTTEASIAQHAAIEKHLATLTANAENLTTGLKPAVAQATDSIERIQQRIRRVLVDAESRAEAVAASITGSLEAISETTEQAGFIEKACARAEHVEARLTAFAEQLADKADKVQERMVELMGGLEASDAAHGKLQTMLEKVTSACKQSQDELQKERDRVTAAHAEASQQADRQRAGLLEAVDKSERVHRQVADEVLEDYRKQVEERFAVMELRQTKAVESARESVRELREEAAALSAEARAAIKEQRGAYEELVSQIETSQRQFVGTSIANYRGELQKELEGHRRLQREVVEAARREFDELRDRISTASAEASGTLQEQLDAHRRLQGEAIGTARREFDELRKHISAASTEALADLKEQLNTHSRLHGEAVEEAHRELDELRGCISTDSADALANLREQVNTHRRLYREVAEEARHELDELREGMSAAATDAAVKLRDQLDIHRARQEELHEEAQNRLQSMQSEASSVISDTGAATEEAVAKYRTELAAVISESQGHVEELKGNLGALTTPVPAIRSSLNELSDDIGHATDKVDVLSKSVTGIKASVNELIRRSEAAKEKLVGAVEHGERLFPEVQENCAKLESLQGSIATMLMELGSAHERIRELREEAGGAEQVTGRLASERQRGEQAAQHLDEAVHTATRLRDDVHRLSVEIEGKTGQLDSHNAAAQNVLHRLADANMSAHSLIAQANDATQAAVEATAETKEEIDCRLKDLRALTSTTDDRAGELSEANRKAGALVETLQRAAGPAAQVAGDLNALIADAKEQCETVVEESARATTLAEHLSPSVEALATAKDMDASMRSTLQDARSVHVGLSSLTNAARERQSQLAETNDSAVRLLDGQQTLMKESKNAAEMLADQLKDSASTAEAGRRLRDEFDRQVQVAEAQLQDLRRMTSEIEERITAAITGPNEIVASARTQAAQLEHVCQAVGKIFSGLARAALAAKEQTKQCHDTGNEAARRLAELSERTEKARQMLQEWSEEAVRVQERLQRTLEVCPTIQQTHSRDVIQAISAPTSKVPMARRGDDPAPVFQPQASEIGKTPHGNVETGFSPKAAEIAQLIEDAKRAAGFSGT